MPDVTVKVTFANEIEGSPLLVAHFSMTLGIGRGVGTLPAPFLTSVPQSLSLPDFAHPTYAKRPPRHLIVQAMQAIPEVNIEY